MIFLSRAQSLCEVMNSERDYPWEITDVSNMDTTIISYKFTQNGDVYEVLGFYLHPLGTLDLSITINGSQRPSFFALSPERIAERSRAAIKCVSILYALVRYVLSHYLVRRLYLRPYGSYSVGSDARFLRAIERFGHLIANKYNGSLVYNVRTDPRGPAVDITIYFRRWRREIRRTQRNRSPANED